jgi:hypothetical protein
LEIESLVIHEDGDYPNVVVFTPVARRNRIERNASAVVSAPEIVQYQIGPVVTPVKKGPGGYIRRNTDDRWSRSSAARDTDYTVLWIGGNATSSDGLFRQKQLRHQCDSKNKNSKSHQGGAYIVTTRNGRRSSSLHKMQ